MPSYDPELTSGEPYYDDFDESKNYLKILFKPGFAVQARELTQLQTALQSQIERFGNHVFKNGTPVLGSYMTEKTVSFARLNSNVEPSVVTLLSGDIVTGTGEHSALRARVVDVDQSRGSTTSDNFPVIFLQYLSGGGTGSNSFGLGEEIFSTTQDISVTLKSSTADFVAVTGDAKAFSIDTGVYFVDGFFVHVTPQTTVPSRLSATGDIERSDINDVGFNASAPEGVRLYNLPTSRIGLSINKKVVDHIDDPTLLDPSNGSFNFSAPGADRYQVDPVLNFKPFIVTSSTPSNFVDEDFLDTLRVEDGVITKRYDRTEYSKLEETLARRTFDESGNYTVRPFTVTALEHFKRDKYQLDVDLTSSSAVFSVGDIVQSSTGGVSGPTAEVLDITDRTLFFGATAQRITVDMNVGRYAETETLSEQGSGDLASGTITNVTFIPDPSGVFEAERGGTTDKLALSVSPGKAYVYGYEFENQSTTIVETDKARTTNSLIGVNLTANVGNHIVVETPDLPLDDPAIKYSNNRFLSYNFGSTPEGTSGPFSLETLPKIDVKGKFVQVNIPFQADAKGNVNMRLFAPLFATEHEDQFDSVGVIDNFSGATVEASSTSLLVGNDSSAYYLPTTIDNQGGFTSSVQFAPGTKVDKNIQKIIFSEDYRSGANYEIGNGVQPNSIGNFADMATTIGSKGVTCSYVRQVFVGNVGETSKERIYVRDLGVARAWVPAESTNFRKNSALFIQSGGTSGIHPDGGVVQQGFAGISGATANCSPVNYGSSISSIINKQILEIFVKHGEFEGVNGYVSDQNYAVGDIIRQKQYTGSTSTSGLSGSFILPGGSFADPSTARTAFGEVVAWVNTTNGPVLYVEALAGNTFQNTCGFTSNTGGFGGGSVIQTDFLNSCGDGSVGGAGAGGLVFAGLLDTVADPGGISYGITDGATSEISVQEVRFKGDDGGILDSNYLEMMNSVGGFRASNFSNSEEAAGTDVETLLSEGIVGRDYKHGQEVYQITNNNLGQSSFDFTKWTNDPNFVNKATVISWDRNQKRLLSQICDNFQGFQRDLGYIYGLYNSVCNHAFCAYGGDGIESTSAVNQRESVIVKFNDPFNISTANFTGFGEFIEGETAEQLLESKSNFIPGKFYTVGERVAQRIPGNNPSGFATGTVVEFTARNSGNSADTSDTVLLIESDSITGGTFEVGVNAKPIVEGTVNSSGTFVQSTTGRITQTNNYGLNGAFFSGSLGSGGSSADQYTKQVPVTMGTARIKQIREQSDDAHQVSLFDIEMFNKRPGVKFFLSEARSIFYGLATSENLAGSVRTNAGKIANIHPSNIGKVFNIQDNKLFFKVPQGDIVKTINSMDYRIQKEFPIVLDPGTNSSTIKSGSSLIRFVGGGSSGGVIEGADINNYILLDNDGKIMDIYSGAFQMFTNNADFGGEGSLTLVKNTGGGTGTFPVTSEYRLIAMLDVNPGSDITSSVIRTKVLLGTADNLGTADVLVDQTGNSFFNLSKADILNVTSIIDTGISATADVTNKFTIDTGQRDNFYDTGKIFVVNNGLSTFGTTTDVLSTVNKTANLVGPLVVSYRYFEHKGDGPIVVSSYLNETPPPDSGELKVTYDDIPEYVSTDTGEVTKLQSVVDFRPIKSPDGTFSKVFIPYSGQSFNVSYSFYLPRIDKLAITRDRRFKVVQGVPSLFPVSPDDVADAMEIYRFDIPAYTFKTSDIVSKSIKNQRFTMNDIGKIKRRVEQLEYYTTLSLLERETESLFIKDANGNNRFKNGIIVDQFSGHGVGNVRNRDYNVSIDFQNQELRPPFVSENVDFDIATLNGMNQTVDGFITLPFDEDIFIRQPLATTSINVNPFSVTNWLGEVKMDPASDNWVDTEQRPDVLVNLEGENDAWEELGSVAFGTQWNDWEVNWTGSFTEAQFRQGNQIGTVTSRIGSGTRTGVENRIVPERIERNIGNRVVDVSVVPFIRTRKIAVTATNMRPNTPVHAFFDNINVDEHCTFLDASGARKRLTESELITDENGAITSERSLTFVIPGGQFRTGERLFRLTDEPSNDVKNAQTSAETTYPAQGILQTQEDVSISTRLPRLQRNSVTEERIITDTNISWQTIPQNRDPVAQTFLVSPSEHANGVFVDSIDVFFKKKSDTLPVTMQIRPTRNGFPHSAAVLPLAEVVLTPEEVNISETPDADSPGTRTRFKFSSPIYLLPQEYSMVILSNSDDYEVFIATMGENQIGTENPVVEQPHLGSLFKSQNASTWTPDQNSDLMFVINKCKFKTAGINTVSFKERKTGSEDSIKLDLFQLNASNINWPTSKFNLSVRMTPNNPSNVRATDEEFAIVANENFELDSSRRIDMNGEENTFVLNATVDGLDPDVSPVLDLSRLSLISVENKIEGNKDLDKTGEAYNGELDPIATPVAPGETRRARYITRQVNLASGFEARNIKVLLTQYKRQNTDIQVFIKQQPSGEDAPFENQPYIQLTPNTTATSESFQEVEYSLDEDLTEPMGKFSIKICLYSDLAPNDTTKYPIVKDLRGIALA
tara:strand:- start:6336 stop:13910 length:7575 start_codon:yes stop_codon:yes gene_type:complete